MNYIKYGKDNKTVYCGVCGHGIKFKDTFIGCETTCVKCNKKGRIVGYNKSKLKVMKNE